MSKWDEVCILCGLRAGFPPQFIAYNRTKSKELLQWVDEVLRLLPKDDLDFTSRRIHTLLDTAMDAYSESVLNQHIMMPRLRAFLGTWRYFHTVVCVGYFEMDEYFGRDIVWSSDWPDEFGFPSGRNVQVKRAKIVWSGDPQVRIYHPIAEDTGSDTDDSDREKGSEEKPIPLSAAHAQGRCPSFYILEGPFYYLKAWLDLESMPSRSVMFSRGKESLSFEGELYEVINSREGRRDGLAGFLPYINYGDLRESVDQYQDCFIRTRNSAVHTTKAIQAHLEGEDLILAMLEDCQAHLYARPDVWPVPLDLKIDDAFPAKKLLPYKEMERTTAFLALPVELFIQILSLAPLSAIFTLAATCTEAHVQVTSQISRIIRTSVLSDTNETSMKWLLPVSTIPGENDRAFEVAWKWLAMANTNSPNSVENPFHHPEFPYLSFMKACYAASAWGMKNRRRIWGMVKQFEKIWRDYRTKGYEVHYFTHES